MNSLIDTFIKLVQIDSPTGHEEKMAAYLMSHFAQRNIFVEKDTIGNVFVRISGKGEPLFLSAHMDTVEPGRGIVPLIEDGVIRSQGDTILGADNKVMIAVILEVIERIKEKEHRPLEILFTVDEESTNTGALGFNYKKLTATKGLICDIALPVGTIVLGSAAYMRIDISLIGKSGHSSFPERAKSIIPALGELLTSVKTGHLDNQTTFNIGVGKFGSTRNTVPGEGILQGDMRGFDEERLHTYTQKVFTQVESIATKYQLKAQTTAQLEQRVYRFAENDPWVQSIAEVMRQQKINPVYTQSWSVSDANYFNQKGLQVVNIGDGTNDSHSTHESIAVADLEKQVAIVEAVCLY
ncbi:MAG: M20/M25/M40 family metallo-hydrolase [Patescibacteria group bacterium]